MKVLLVIHGYPPYYMAGSEVYTYNLARQLAKTNEVYVFCRFEDKTKPLYSSFDKTSEGVNVRYINNYEAENATFYDKYLNPTIDDMFREYVNIVKPDVVHIGHLSHLSTQIPIIAKREFGLPVLFTIHDFWMFCHRGQLINPENWNICSLPNTKLCTQCAAFHYKNPTFSSNLIKEREAHIKNVIDCIDVFFAPSHTLEKFFIDMGVDKSKVFYSKYGFNISQIKKHTKHLHKTITFGFTGRIIYTKGVHLLCEAFCRVKGNAKLVIWGDAENEYARGLVKKYSGERIEFKGCYHNDDIQKVLDSFDILVCPSIWLENAPLVIQESQSTELPVLVSDKGGMAELVHNGEDGFTFKLGSEEDLFAKMQDIVDNPQKLLALKAPIENVRTIEEDAEFCVQKYNELSKKDVVYPHMPSPWRMTFITNPDKCNLHCKMCDTFSVDNRGRLKTDHRPEMDFSLVEKTVSALAPHGLKEIIPSTMGEPLLYSHFEQLVELCRKNNIKMNLTTNGTFPKGGVEFWTPKLLDVISDVKFSINGINPEVNGKIMCGINTEKQLRNIEYYLDYRKRAGNKSTVTLQCTFMKSNLYELKNLILWSIEHGVDRVKGHHLWKTSDSLDSEMLRTGENASLWNSVCTECNVIAEGKIKLENFVPIDLDKPAIDGKDTFCQFLGKELWIEYDGSYQICCCPSEVRKEFGDFGNVSHLSPLEMWNGGKYTSFIANWGESENCKKCNMRRKR
ncbi:MAG: glycosyltransferase [Bacteroidales bacterium]|nr:glycosyltransferase [Bacteroidales bacterium]